MRKLTDVISYNLNERGRSFTGVDRDIDIAAAMRLVNGPVVQEHVKKGDIFGYVGHGFRETYGLDVPETVIVDGKTVVLEPAIRTVMIKVLPDGTLEHQQEFLNSSSGRVAERLYRSKAYGFSSAFYAPEENGKRIPRNYFGMDLVRSPNYDTNRGYDSMLDSTDAGAFGVKGFAAESAALLDSVDQILIASEAQSAAIQVQADEISEAYLRQCAENNELVDFNARLLMKLRALERGGGGMLDSTSPDTLVRGHTYNPSVADELLDSAQAFMKVDLTGFQQGPEEKKTTDALQRSRALVNRLIGRG